MQVLELDKAAAEAKRLRRDNSRLSGVARRLLDEWRLAVMSGGLLSSSEVEKEYLCRLKEIEA